MGRAPRSRRVGPRRVARRAPREQRLVEQAGEEDAQLHHQRVRPRVEVRQVDVHQVVVDRVQPGGHRVLEQQPPRRDGAAAELEPRAVVVAVEREREAELRELGEHDHRRRVVRRRAALLRRVHEERRRHPEEDVRREDRLLERRVEAERDGHRGRGGCGAASGGAGELREPDRRRYGRARPTRRPRRRREPR